jgi:hypothetical protein
MRLNQNMKKLKKLFRFKKPKNGLTKKNPTVFINRDQKKIKPLSTKRSIQKIAKRSFTRNAPINLLGKLTQISRWIWLSIIVALAIGITYTTLFTDIFVIKKILVFEGEQESTNLQIRRISEPLRNRNIFLFSKKELLDSIIKRVDNLNNLRVIKTYPDTVTIQYNKYNDVANVVNLIGRAKVRKSFILNQNGVLVEQDKISSTLPTINVESEKAYNVNDKIISIADLNYILESRDYYEEKFNMKISEIKYLPIPKEVRLRTERGFEVWIDMIVDYKEQLNKLKNAIPKINLYEGELEYIDLRIQSAQGQKIIYR